MYDWRNNRGKRWVLTSVVLIAVLILSVVGQAAEPSFGGTLRIGTLTGLDSFNVLASNSVSDSWVLNLMYPSLLIFNENGQKIGYLAKDWGYSEDGLTAWFELRDGVKWADGVPITSEDVKFTADITKEHRIGFNAFVLNAVTEVRTPTPTRVEFVLSKPNGPFLATIGFWLRVVPKHIWKDVEDPKRYPNMNPVGAGPFKLVDYRLGQYYELEAVDEWFDAPAGRPYLDKVIFKVYPDINTLILALQKGEIDVSAQPIPPASVARVKRTPRIVTVTAPSLGYYYMGFNMKRESAPSLADVTVRQAFAMAINKEMIRKMVLRGQAIDTAVAVTPVLADWYNPDVESYPYDPEKAKAMLEAAGYRDTDGDGIRETPAGEKMSYELLFDGGETNILKAVKMIQQDLSKVGIEINLEAVERNTYLTMFRNADFDLMCGKWGIMDEPADYLYLIYHSETYGTDGINHLGLNNPELDVLLEEARQATDMEVAKEKVFKIQEKLHELVPDIELWVDTFTFAYRDDFAGFRVYPSEVRGPVDPQSLVRVYKVK